MSQRPQSLSVEKVYAGPRKTVFVLKSSRSIFENEIADIDWSYSPRDLNEDIIHNP